MEMKGFIATLCALLLVLSLVIPLEAASLDNGSREPPVTVHFFWGEGCPHCARAKPFLAELEGKYPGLKVKSYEVYKSQENLGLLMEMAKSHGAEVAGVPIFFIGGKVFSGFSDDVAKKIDAAVRYAFGNLSSGEPGKGERDVIETPEFTLPLIGKVDMSSTSLPIFTLIIAGLDSFNPCAFFVLFFLLSLLIHVHSRKRMLIVGGTFVFFSGFIYFLFMAAWLNLFLITGQLALITTIAALVALFIAAINIKDFFFFEEGISLVIPEEAKPKLFDRMRHIVHAGSLPMMLAGTLVLAVAANTYELLCTAGFPMVYTRVLTLNRLSTAMYYVYLALYNMVYVIPLAIIVVVFVVTLGSRKLTEWHGRLLKLISGCMMLGLGVVLLVKPALLSNALVSTALLAGTLVVAMVMVWIVKWRKRKREA